MPLTTNDVNFTSNNNFKDYIYHIFTNTQTNPQESDIYELNHLSTTNHSENTKVYLLLSFQRQIKNGIVNMRMHSQRISLNKTNLKIIQKHIDEKQTTIGICLTDLNIPNKHTYLIQNVNELIADFKNNITLVNELKYASQLKVNQPQSLQPYTVINQYVAEEKNRVYTERTTKALYIMHLFLAHPITIFPKGL